jgi:stage II sporulation protein D
MNLNQGKDAMAKHLRWIGLLLLLLLLPPQGCSQDVQSPPASAGGQIIRVRLLEDLQSATVSASDSLRFSLSTSPGQRFVRIAPNSDASLLLSATTWTLGGANLGGGILTLQAGPDGTLRINHAAYRGALRFVPVGNDKFDVVNDVAVEDYLKGVVPKEMYRDWHAEAFKAQAVVARTYALYESRTAGVGRYWDVYDDQRSQVYGGIGAESPQTSRAVNATAGKNLQDLFHQLLRRRFGGGGGCVSRRSVHHAPQRAISRAVL